METKQKPRGRWHKLLDSFWWLQLVLNPPMALDLTDARTGKVDHGKILPAILLFAAITAQFTGVPFAIGALIVLGSLAYGYGAWRAFLKSRVVTSKESVHTSTSTSTVISKRDPVSGVQPTADRDWDGTE